MNLKILITGGAGFIGSHLTESYLKKGHFVYIIDDLSTGSLDNIKPLMEHPEYKDRLFVTVDTILNTDTMLELVGTCDRVIHLAAAVGVRHVLDNPLMSLTTNLRGTGIVLELCNKFRKKVMMASSSEVYGKHDHAPLTESDDTVFGSVHNWRWSYGATKLVDEFAALAYHKENQLPVVIVRLFNTAGPRQTGEYGMVVPRLVHQALRNDVITVYGDGTQTRTFTHVRDVVECIERLLEAPEAFGQVFNIGGREEISIRALAERIVKLTGSHSEIKLLPYEDVYPTDFEDMKRRVPSTEKLRKVIGMAPETDLDTILAEVISYCRSKM